MKKLITLSIITFSCFMHSFAFANAADEKPLDQIVAIVNDDVVTKTEFNQAITTIKNQLAQQNVATPPNTILQKQVLDQLINKKLQIQIAKQANVQIPDADIDGAIKNIAKQNNMSIDELYNQLGKEGMKPIDYRNEIRDQMAMQRLQQQEIAGKMTVTKQEVNAYMRSHPLQMDATKEYRIEDILIPLADTPSPADIQSAKARATDIAEKIKTNKDYDKKAVQSGDLGYRQLPEIPSAFAEIVSKMKPQSIAGPIQTPNGFHILRLTDVRSAETKSAAPTRKQIEDFLLQQKFAEAVQSWVSKLRSQAFIVTNPTK